jgi:ribonucleotide monophosphatase NagD (HAD superfamily)
MHNGKESLPGAVECVKQLSSLGKKLIILSNTSAPSEAALAKLPKLGFDPSHFVGAVTSGEEASRFILEKYGSNADTNADAVASVGKKAIILTWADNLTSDKFLEKCGNVKPTFNYSEADFVLAHGSQVLRNNVSEGDNLSLGSFMENGDLSSIEPILKKCKEHNLDMVCANPDFIVKVGDGSIAHMPGE